MFSFSLSFPLWRRGKLELAYISSSPAPVILPCALYSSPTNLALVLEHTKTNVGVRAFELAILPARRASWFVLCLHIFLLLKVFSLVGRPQVWGLLLIIGEGNTCCLLLGSLKTEPQKIIWMYSGEDLWKYQKGKEENGTGMTANKRCGNKPIITVGNWGWIPPGNPGQSIIPSKGRIWGVYSPLVEGYSEHFCPGREPLEAKESFRQGGVAAGTEVSMQGNAKCHMGRAPQCLPGCHWELFLKVLCQLKELVIMYIGRKSQGFLEDLSFDLSPVGCWSSISNHSTKEVKRLWNTFQTEDRTEQCKRWEEAEALWTQWEESFNTSRHKSLQILKWGQYFQLF